MNKLRLSKNHHGFALVEILLALAIFGMLASALAPSIIARAQIRGSQRLVSEITELQNAAKAYYVDTGGWPGSIGALKDARYLPAEWDGKNPFGGEYSLVNIGPYAALQTDVPAELVQGIARNLPLATVSGGQIRSNISLPGQMADLSELYKEIDRKVKYITEEWIPENVVIEEVGSKAIGWWSNYNAYRPGYLYGNKMDTKIINLKVGREGSDPEEYEMGLTIPTRGEVRTRYQWNPDNPGGVLYVYKDWKDRQ